VLRRYIGEQLIRQETLDQLVPEAYRQALQDSGVEPIADPEVELLTMEPDQPLSFKATIPVAPTVTLGDYRAIRLERQPVEVTEEQIDAVIEDLRKQYATWEEVTDRGVEKGDRITADVHCEAEGQSLIDSHDQQLTVGDNGLPDEVDEGLVGTAAGEERTVIATLPEDYPRAELAGKEATYTIAVKTIQKPILPPVDDELAKKTPDVQDVAGLRENIRARLQESGEAAEANRLRTEAVKSAIAGSTLEYPALLVERELDRSLETFVANIARQGFDPEQYFRMIGVTPEDLRARWRPEAEETVKRQLVLGEVAKAEGLEPNETQLVEELQRNLSGVPEQQLPGLLNNNPRLIAAIQSSARDRLALERLVELATATERPPAGDAPSEGEASADEPSGLNAAIDPAETPTATEEEASKE
jgi:trigger factor